MTLSTSHYIHLHVSSFKPHTLACYLCHHSLATRVAPRFASARFVVMSRLQEMQHYICLQPTGTRTRSCYMIKECYPERVCVWLNPLGLATNVGLQANQNGERKNSYVWQGDEKIWFKTFNILILEVRSSQRKSLLLFYVCLIVQLFLQYASSVFVGARVQFCVAELTFNPPAPS